MTATAEQHPMTNGDDAWLGAWVEPTHEPGTVRLGGELDMASCPAVERALIGAVRPAAALIIDCERLTFCDSSGLATLMAVRDRAETESATVRLTNVAPNVVRVMKMTALLETFGVEEPGAAG
jgi:anti-anti-sigma factor